MDNLPKTNPVAAVSCSSGPLEAGRTSGCALRHRPERHGLPLVGWSLCYA